MTRWTMAYCGYRRTVCRLFFGRTQGVTMGSEALLEAMRIAQTLMPDERVQLIAFLAESIQEVDLASESRPKWSDLVGTVPYPALGEDAQQWVSRTRAASDHSRRRRSQNAP